MGTPVGPHMTPGKTLCFLASASPEADVLQDFGEAQHDLEDRSWLETEQEVDDNLDVPTLQAVEPVYPRSFSRDSCPPEHDLQFEGSESVFAAAEKPPAEQRGSQKSAANIIPSAAKHMSAQAFKAKEQVSGKVHRSIGFVKEHAEGALRVPAQVSENLHKGIGFMKEQTGSALKVPAQMSGTAQKSFVYAKEKAGSAREKAQTVSAVVTAKMTQTTQKGFDIARSMRSSQARSRPGGA